MELTNHKYEIKKQNKFFIKAVDKETRVIILKVFGITFQHAKGVYYENFVTFLNYISPICEIPNDIIENFSKKSKKYIVNANTYLKDLATFRKIIENIQPSSLPKASGKTRQSQLRELEFVKEILKDIEENTGLKPFMDDGTLLGAVRHKGFIPWDDDVDFSLMRKDFEKLEEYFKNRYKWIDTNNWNGRSFKRNIRSILTKNPDRIVCLKRNTSMKCFKMIDGKITFCDFFALDCFSDEFNLESLQKYIKSIKKQLHKFKTFGEIFNFYKKEVAKNIEIVSDSNTIYAGIDNFDFYNYTPKKIRQKNDIFPLKKMQFEDTEFWAPNNEVNCLESIYTNYQKIPTFIPIEQHNMDKKNNFLKKLLSKK